MMMNTQGSGSARYNNSIGLGDGVGAEGFLDMFGDHHSSGDLFDLVWQGGAGGGSSSMELQPSHLPSSPAPVVLPPSEDEMAAWLYPIVRGEELVFTGQLDDHPGDLAGHAAAAAAADDQQAPGKEAADHEREKLPKTEDKCRAEDSSSFSLRKKATEGARKSHHAEAHNLTEKRRRCKISEKFKTLQQLVPGCDKSNQVSTLDQTIQYMKSLQQQIQAMSFGCGMNPAAVYPVVPPPYLPPPATAAPGVLVRGQVRSGVVLEPPPAMVPFGPLLPLVHTTAPLLYPAAAAPNIRVVAAPSVRENISTSRNKG